MARTIIVGNSLSCWRLSAIQVHDDDGAEVVEPLIYAAALLARLRIPIHLFTYQVKWNGTLIGGMHSGCG